MGNVSASVQLSITWTAKADAEVSVCSEVEMFGHHAQHVCQIIAYTYKHLIPTIKSLLCSYVTWHLAISESTVNSSVYKSIQGQT